MSVDILGTSWDQCRSMVQYSFTSTETRRLVRTDSPGRPPRLIHSSWTMSLSVGWQLSETYTRNHLWQRLEVECRNRLLGVCCACEIQGHETSIKSDSQPASIRAKFLYCNRTIQVRLQQPEKSLTEKREKEEIQFEEYVIITFAITLVLNVQTFSCLVLLYSCTFSFNLNINSSHVTTHTILLYQCMLSVLKHWFFLMIFLFSYFFGHRDVLICCAIV